MEGRREFGPSCHRHRDGFMYEATRKLANYLLFVDYLHKKISLLQINLSCFKCRPRTTQFPWGCFLRNYSKHLQNTRLYSIQQKCQYHQLPIPLVSTNQRVLFGDLACRQPIRLVAFPVLSDRDSGSWRLVSRSTQLVRCQA